MVRIIVFLLTAFLFTSFSNSEDDYTACITKYESRWGAACTQCKVSDNSYRVSLRNTCDDTIDVKCAVQESDKHWKFFIKLAMAPKDTMIAYACEGTGKYLYWARKADDTSIFFPTDEAINEQFKK